MKNQLLLSFIFCLAFTYCSKPNKIEGKTNSNKEISKSSFINYLGQPKQNIDTTEFKKIEYNKICEEEDCWIVTRYYWNEKEWAEIEGDSLVGAITSITPRCFQNSKYQNIIEDIVLNQLKIHKKSTFEFSAIGGYYIDISVDDKEGAIIYSDCFKDEKLAEKFLQYFQTGNYDSQITDCKINQLRVVKIFEKENN